MMKRNMSARVFLMLLVAVFLSLQASASGQIQRINGTTTHNHYPKISGNYVAWRGDDGGSAGIFLYDGSTVSQISHPVEGLPGLDWVSSIDGGKVAWTGLLSSWTSREVFFYDGSAVSRLTDNSDGDQDPRISGNNVVWSTLRPSGETAVYRYDCISVQRLTNPGEKGWTPDIDGINIVWEGDSGIVLYDGTTETVLPNSSRGNYPRISGTNVVWISNDGTNRYVSRYDGTTTTVIGTNPRGGLLELPLVSGSIIAWLGYDGHDQEVFYYDGIQTIQVTNNEVNEQDLAISDKFAAWVASDGYDMEVYAFDFSSQATFKVTDNDIGEKDPDVSGDVVVWADSNGDVWMTTVPEPGTLSLLAVGGLALIRRRPK